MNTMNEIKLYAQWSVINNAYMILFGSAPCGLGSTERIFWPNLAELAVECAALGLRMRPSGRGITRRWYLEVNE
jgi:hypothetical protein